MFKMETTVKAGIHRKRLTSRKGNASLLKTEAKSTTVFAVGPTDKTNHASGRHLDVG